MAKEPVLSDIVNILTSATTLNANWAAIKSSFDNTLSLDGSTPNSMQADLDMNSNDILNAAIINGTKIVTTNIILNGQTLTPGNLTSLDASDLVVSPTGSITSTDVQAALAEIDTDRQTNTTNIATNTTNIATNTTNIATNATNIATNATNIGHLTSIVSKFYTSFSSMLADTATFTAGTLVAIPSIGAVYEAVASGGNLVQTNAGGQNYNVLSNGGMHVDHFGAAGDGTTNDSTIIQRAIDATANGEDVKFSAKTYAISSSLYLGDGSSSAASTKWGIRLIGAGVPPWTNDQFTGFPDTGVTKILWTGASGAYYMIEILGPLIGWGIQNMLLDGAGNAARGIEVLSASSGDSRNLLLRNFTDSAILEEVLSSVTGWGLANSQNNAYYNLYINVPAVTGAKGITLDGDPSATPLAANSCYARFDNVMIYLAASTANFGVYLHWTDSPVFTSLHIWGGGSSAKAIHFDYTKASGDNMPSGCGFVSVDSKGASSQSDWSHTGTPGVGARPNWIQGLDQLNNGDFPSDIPNLHNGLPLSIASVNALDQAAPITGSTLGQVEVTGTYRVSYTLTSTVGSGTGTMSFALHYNDGYTSKTQTSGTINASGTAPQVVSGSFVFRAIANQTITWDVVWTSITGSPQYMAQASLERIA